MLDKDGYLVKRTPWECTERLCQFDPEDGQTCAPGCPFYDDRLERAMDEEHILALKQIIRDSKLAPHDPCVGIRVDHGEAGEHVQYEVNYRDGGKVIVHFDAVDQVAKCLDADWMWTDPMPYPCGQGCAGCFFDHPYLKCYYTPPKKGDGDGLA